MALVALAGCISASSAFARGLDPDTQGAWLPVRAGQLVQVSTKWLPRLLSLAHLGLPMPRPHQELPGEGQAAQLCSGEAAAWRWQTLGFSLFWEGP